MSRPSLIGNRQKRNDLNKISQRFNFIKGDKSLVTNWKPLPLTRRLWWHETFDASMSRRFVLHNKKLRATNLMQHNNIDRYSVDLCHHDNSCLYLCQYHKSSQTSIMSIYKLKSFLICVCVDWIERKFLTAELSSQCAQAFLEIKTKLEKVAAITES